MRTEIKKNKESGKYRVFLHIGAGSLSYENLNTKDDAESFLANLKMELDRDRIRKVRSTLTDADISSLSYEEYPMSSRGVFENMIVDLLRKEFVKKAKKIRDMLMSINLNDKEYESE
jgi:hypothetical protein